jgi:hypothetical protein
MRSAENHILGEHACQTHGQGVVVKRVVTGDPTRRVIRSRHMTQASDQHVTGTAGKSVSRALEW